ncbi:Beta-lactamase [Sphingomonas guangdongensis]|uniref:Beta-lactamase n=1 Tax=Sphingomonas guangdongensis TaxID=1141890 RepID=A0A285QDK5_9SPHN|nr:serine hydrolase domain-containing protein [Sphingomonas guangdongensis]SOB79608.1 Beta-lactamase [Sphingomonas guangdongensis]
MIARVAALLAALLATPAIAQPRPDLAPVLAEHKFEGFALAADADTILWQTPRAPCPAPTGGEIILCHPSDPAFQRWPWASVTKQVVAVLTMQQVDRGRLALDAPAARYLPQLATGAPSPTIRQLLQHRAGLRNPEDTPKDAEGWPAWFTASDDALGWCLAGRTATGGDWRYNNCDTLVLGAVLENVADTSLPELFDREIARPLQLEATAFESSAAPPRYDGTAVTLTKKERAIFKRFGAAGGLIGTPLDLLAIDRALMAGTLLSPASRDAMWAGDPKLGYMALAQWSFDAPLKGCAAPVRLIERRGGIGRFQVRNILILSQNKVLMLFTADGDFDFGEIWQGKGLSHDLLARVACP